MHQTDSNCCGVLNLSHYWKQKGSTQASLPFPVPMKFAWYLLKSLLEMKVQSSFLELASVLKWLSWNFVGRVPVSCGPDWDYQLTAHRAQNSCQAVTAFIHHPSPLLFAHYCHFCLSPRMQHISFQMFRAVSVCRSVVGLQSEINILNDVFPRRLLSL